MKKIITIIAVMGSFISSQALEIETIQLQLKEYHSKEWYSQQAQSWKQIIQKEANPEAWMNYYLASKYSNNLAEASKSLNKMKSDIIGTFEYHFINFLQTQKYSELDKAYRANEYNKIAYPFLIQKGELENNYINKKRFCDLLLESNYLPQGVYSYNYNLLMSVEENGVLLVENKATSIPLYILQESKSVRQDVSVIDLDLLMNLEYRESIFKENGIVIPPNSSMYKKELLVKAIVSNNPSKSIYLSSAIDSKNTKGIEKLYLTGLASKYSEQRIDNTAILKRNWEQNFLTDYLKMDFANEDINSTSHLLNSNYIAPAIMLYEHYEALGEFGKADEVKKIALNVAEKIEMKDELLFYLSKEKKHDLPFIKYEINIKELDKKLKPLTNNLYAYETEVSNKEYNLFLNYLKEYDLINYEKCKAQIPEGNSTLKSMFNVYHADGSLDGIKNPFDDYPVINVTQDAAKLYCEWLTKQYNSAKRKKHENVAFRLPTEKEWKMAAIGSFNTPTGEVKDLLLINTKKQEISYKDNVINYPWWSGSSVKMASQYKNPKGCYLLNAKVKEEDKDCKTCPVAGDPFEFTSPVNAYFPNDLWLYDMVGNVAEMIDEYGKAFGGSWDSSPEESTIHSIIKYDNTDSRVGFRVFMEINNSNAQSYLITPKLPVPPGTKAVQNNMFMDDAEITNFAWAEFLAYIKKDSSANFHQSMLPDTNIFDVTGHFKDPYIKYYFNHPGFKFFPVVGISYEQAQAYCKWRSAAVNRNWNKNNTKSKYKNYEAVFTYRLPSRLEWEKAASGTKYNIDYPWEGADIKNDKGYFLMNFKNKEKINTTHQAENKTPFTSYIYQFPPNEYGLYGMSGNVAEMVSEKGISKGGSWNDASEDCKISSDIKYEKQTAMLGFRCIAEVKLVERSPGMVKK